MSIRSRRLVIVAFACAMGLGAPMQAGAAAPCEDAAASATARAAVLTACDCDGGSVRTYQRCVRDVLRARTEAGMTSRACAKDAGACLRGSTCGRSAAVICRTETGQCRRRATAQSCERAGGVVTFCRNCCDGCFAAPACGTAASTPPTCGGTCAPGNQCQWIIASGFGGCLCVPSDVGCHTVHNGVQSSCDYGTCPSGTPCASLILPDGSGNFVCGCGSAVP